MDDFLRVCKKSPLFEGIEEAEIKQMTACLGMEVRHFQRDELLYRAGDTVAAIGLVLSGQVYIVREDFWGNRDLVGAAGPGETFAESYACAAAPLAVSVSAGEAVTAAFFDVRRVLTTCRSTCAFHTRLVQNLLSVLAEKNLRMNEKLSHVTQRTLREKLLSYLSGESARAGSARFDIPFNRQQLADYLSADRSALSAELSKMRRDGILTFEKNHFCLL